MPLDVTKFKLPQQIEEYRKAVAEFVLSDLEPIANQIENTVKVPKEMWPKLQQSGLLRLTMPKEYGGFGLTYSQYFPILEEVAKTHGTIRLIVHTWNWLYYYQFLKYGSAEQKKLLPKIASGDHMVAWALTEPDTGTGLDLKMTAKRDGDSLVINGKKHLISLAMVADTFIIFAKTDPSAGRRGFSSLAIPKGAKGFTVIPQPDTMGLRGDPHGVVAILDFKNCRVPASTLIGPEGSGLDQALETLDVSRLSIGVTCLGLSQRFLDLSVHYAQRRTTFGKTLAERQAVQQMIADMATDVHALRLMTTDATLKVDRGLPCRKEAAMCKLFGIETVRKASDKALEIHGGLGFTRVFPIERMYRDARGPWLEEGTPTIQRSVIAREVLKS
ncbi:MAG: acyl-CoA dehydrogenase family protein [Dehalococcoidia bacterium]|nr:acyl-CoA dehydrogenase family protein [Dehalococcoidia bacterium]